MHNDRCIHCAEQETEIQRVAAKPTGSAVCTCQLADAAFDTKIPRLIDELLHDPEYTSIDTQTTSLPGSRNALEPQLPGSESANSNPNGCKYIILILL